MLLVAILCTLVCLSASEIVQDIEERENRFVLVLNNEDWATAAYVCRNNTGHLFYPKTQDEVTRLVNLMTLVNVTEAHIGFHDLFGEGRYTTMEDKPIVDTCYSDWAEDYPQVGSAFNCGRFTVDGLTNGACEDELPYVCDANLWREYELIEGRGYYKYHMEQLSWSDALQICQEEGAQLLVLNSEEELLELRNYFDFDYSWIGAQHVLVDRQFLTVNDVPLGETGFERWSLDQPSGSNTEFPYVQLMASQGYRIENNEQTFICKRHV